MTASVDASLFPDHAADPSELVRKADVALYRAKAGGKDTFAVFASTQREGPYRLACSFLWQSRAVSLRRSRVRLFATSSGLNRSISFLFIAPVVNSLGHSVHPFLTLFLTQKIGMNPAAAGFFVYLSAFVWVPGSAYA